jgi:hypothetical protein
MCSLLERSLLDRPAEGTQADIFDLNMKIGTHTESLVKLQFIMSKNLVHFRR